MAMFVFLKLISIVTKISIFVYGVYICIFVRKILEIANTKIHWINQWILFWRGIVILCIAHIMFQYDKFVWNQRLMYAIKP